MQFQAIQSPFSNNLTLINNSGEIAYMQQVGLDSDRYFVWTKSAIESEDTFTKSESHFSRNEAIIACLSFLGLKVEE